MSVRESSWTIIIVLSFSLAARAEDPPKIISKTIDSGQLVTTSKMKVDDGLFLTLGFVVIDPSQPEAQRLNGMVAIVLLENHVSTKDYNLSSKTRVFIRKGNTVFSLARPEERDFNGVLKALDFSYLTAVNLLVFLKDAGDVSIEVDGNKHQLSDVWNQHVSDLVAEVDAQRQKKGYKLSLEEVEVAIYSEYKKAEIKTIESSKRLPRDRRPLFLNKSQTKTINEIMKRYKISKDHIMKIIKNGRLRNRE
jgi:hypothetical protein